MILMAASSDVSLLRAWCRKTYFTVTVGSNEERDQKVHSVQIQKVYSVFSFQCISLFDVHLPQSGPGVFQLLKPQIRAVLNKLACIEG